jgi:hypothetical protein
MADKPVKHSGKSAQLGQGVQFIGDPEWVPLVENGHTVGRARPRDDGGVDWETDNADVGARLFRGEWATFSLGGKEVEPAPDAPKLHPDAPEEPNAKATAKGKAD